MNSNISCCASQLPSRRPTYVGLLDTEISRAARQREEKPKDAEMARSNYLPSCDRSHRSYTRRAAFDLFAHFCETHVSEISGAYRRFCFVFRFFSWILAVQGSLGNPPVPSQSQQPRQSRRNRSLVAASQFSIHAFIREADSRHG